MVILSTLFFILLATLMCAYPLFYLKPTQFKDKPVVIDFSKKNALLASINEVEEDRLLGKLNESDYNRLKAQFQREYINLK